MKAEPILAQFCDAIEKVVAQFSDMDLTTGEAVGGLEMIKAKIIRDAQESEDEE